MPVTGTVTVSVSGFAFAFIVAVGIATPSLAASPPGPPPLSIEEGCDPIKLAPMLSAQPKQIPTLIADLDRRIQTTLAEERRQESMTAEEGKQEGGVFRTSERVLIAVVLLAVLSLFAGIQAVRRTTQSGAVAAWTMLLLAGGLAYRQGQKQHNLDGERQLHAERALGLTACRLRLQETRGLLEHAQLAHCINDLDEADEDIVGWLAKMKGGAPVTEAEVAKVHGEIQASLRPQ